MKSDEVELIIKECLDEFYRRRLLKLNQLKLNDTLKRKNPYLFRATGMQSATDVVEGILAAFTSSSDEGIFGDTFFEPLAKLVSGGTVSPSEGVDIAIESADKYTAISVKSGPNIFNASQAKRMNDEFNGLKSRLQKLHKQFDALLGHGYGRKNNELTAKRHYRIRSGQAFWEELTGDDDFYLKIIRLMREYPRDHRLEYIAAYNKALNRFTKEFLNNFSNEDGVIDWEKLVEYNSGKARMMI